MISYGQNEEINSTVVKYTYYVAIDSVETRTLLVPELTVDTSFISFEEAYRIALSKDSLFKNFDELLSYRRYELKQYSDSSIMWQFEYNTLTPCSNYIGRIPKYTESKAWIWIDQNGKITWYKRKRKVFRGIIDF